MIDLDIPKCPVYKKCSGCQLQNLSYSQQLDHKQAMSIGILGDYCHVSPITGMYYPLHYRNKISAVFAENRGKAVCGVWQSSSKKIVQNDGCMIEDKISSEIIKDICDIVTSSIFLLLTDTAGQVFCATYLCAVASKQARFLYR